jgi:stage II sporulation protein D
MKKENIFSIKLLYVLAAFFVVSLSAVPVLYAETDIEEEIEQKEEEKEEKEGALEESEDLEETYLEEGQSTQEQLSAIKDELDNVTSEKKEAEKKLNKAKDEKEVKKETLEKRQKELTAASQELYKFSFVNVLELVFSSGGTEDIIKKIGFLKHGVGSVLKELRNVQKELEKVKEEFKNLSDEVTSFKADIAKYEEQKIALENQVARYERKAANEASRQEDLKDDIADIVSDIENLSEEAQEAIDSKTGDGQNPGGGGNPGGGDSPQDPMGDPGTYDIYKSGQLVADDVKGPVRFVPDNSSVFTVDNGSGKYRGVLEVRADTNVFLINELDMELYLRGIGEVYSSWPVDTLKSQAVIARTYAGANWSKRIQDGYNLRDDTYDQNYVGYGKEAAAYGERWVSAVQATKGEVLHMGGNIITAYYHSTCGGHTLSSAQVWGGSRNFAQAKSDWYSSGGSLRSYDADSPWSYKRWCGSSSQGCTSAENINNTELEDLLNATLYLSVNPESSTRQQEVRRSDLGGLSPAQIRSRLGIGNTIKDKVGNIIEVKSIYNNGSSNIALNSYRTVSLRVVGSASTIDLDATPFWLVFNVRAPGSAHIFYSNFWTVKKEGGSWNFYTRGYPHRVGLCQYGAKGRAQAGQKYDQILAHYYNGAAIKQYNPPSNIRIGLTKVGGSTTLIAANGDFVIFSAGDKVERGKKNQTFKIIKN